MFKQINAGYNDYLVYVNDKNQSPPNPDLIYGIHYAFTWRLRMLTPRLVRLRYLPDSSATTAYISSRPRRQNSQRSHLQLLRIVLSLYLWL